MRILVALTGRQQVTGCTLIFDHCAASMHHASLHGLVCLLINIVWALPRDCLPRLHSASNHPVLGRHCSRGHHQIGRNCSHKWSGIRRRQITSCRSFGRVCAPLTAQAYNRWRQAFVTATFSPSHRGRQNPRRRQTHVVILTTQRGGPTASSRLGVMGSRGKAITSFGSWRRGGNAVEIVSGPFWGRRGGPG